MAVIRCKLMRFDKEDRTMDAEKTPEQLREEMIQNIMKNPDAQYTNEVAMPGVVMPVNPDKK